ncbi:sigma-70 region 2 domain protein [Alloactinosynnema sp. L-07]|nr:sigma-70 region 2 domain protein [Alloactinosynnema sp. L-07]
MSTTLIEFPEFEDGRLASLVRAGTVSAYGSLYERHVGAARNLARQLTRSPAEADDLVSEAFAKVLDTLRQGRGPDSAFRAYLLTALRHTAYDKTRRDKKVELSDDVSQVSGVNPDQVAVPFSDTAVAGLERSLAARAFAMLPERWQAVLWHTEIEGQNPAQVAPILGLTPNGVSALAYRAREGLRQAYLQVHLAENSSDRCRATADRLGAWVRGGLSKRETAQVELHLDDCERCRALSAELADTNTTLPRRHCTSTTRALRSHRGKTWCRRTFTRRTHTGQVQSDKASKEDAITDRAASTRPTHCNLNRALGQISGSENKPARAGSQLAVQHGVRADALVPIGDPLSIQSPGSHPCSRHSVLACAVRVACASHVMRPSRVDAFLAGPRDRPPTALTTRAQSCGPAPSLWRRS